jgi:hypothetical protein
MQAFADLMRAGLDILPTALTSNPGIRLMRRLSFAPRTVRGLARALADAFTAEEFEAFLRLRLNLSLDSISNSGGPFSERINDVVKWAIDRGVQGDLVEAARQSRPDNPELLGVASELGISTIAPPGADLSSVVGGVNAGPVESREWQRNLGLIEPCVGVVEFLDGRILGTGFLIGSDLVLTAAHVLGSIPLSGPPRIRARFDQKGTATGRPSPGTLLDMAENWLVALSPQPDLDIVVLRLRTSPGLQPIGTARVEASAALRGWVHLDNAIDLLGGEDVYCLYFDLQSPSTHLAAGQCTAAAAHQVWYQLNLPPGASGAPCFNRQFQLSGMITGVSGQDCIGTAASAINQYLLDHGLGEISFAALV